MNTDEERAALATEITRLEDEVEQLERDRDQAHATIGRLLMAEPGSDLAKWIAELRREFVGVS